MTLATESAIRIESLGNLLYSITAHVSADRPFIPYLTTHAPPSPPSSPDFESDVLVMMEGAGKCDSRPPVRGVAWSDVCSFPPHGLGFNGWDVANASATSYELVRRFTLEDLVECGEMGKEETDRGVRYTAPFHLFFVQCRDFARPELGASVFHYDHETFEITIVENGEVAARLPSRLNATVRYTAITPFDGQVEIGIDTIASAEIGHATLNGFKTPTYIAGRSHCLPPVANTTVAGVTVTDDLCHQRWLLRSRASERVTEFNEQVEMVFVTGDGERTFPMNLLLKNVASQTRVFTEIMGDVRIYRDPQLTEEYVFPDTYVSGDDVYLKVTLNDAIKDMAIEVDEIVACVPVDESLIVPFNPAHPDKTGCWSPNAGITDERRFIVMDSEHPENVHRAEYLNATVLERTDDGVSSATFKAVPFTSSGTDVIVLQVLYKPVLADKDASRRLLAGPDQPVQSQTQSVLIRCREGTVPMEPAVAGDPTVCVSTAHAPTYVNHSVDSGGVSAAEIAIISVGVAAVGIGAAAAFMFARKRRRGKTVSGGEESSPEERSSLVT